MLWVRAQRGQEDDVEMKMLSISVMPLYVYLPLFTCLSICIPLYIISLPLLFVNLFVSGHVFADLHVGIYSFVFILHWLTWVPPTHCARSYTFCSGLVKPLLLGPLVVVLVS